MNGYETSFHNDDRLSGAFGRSVMLHALLFGSLAAYAWWNPHGPAFGSENAGALTVGVTTFEEPIPLPSRGPENPVANDTQNDTPQAEPEKPAPKEAPEPDPKDAIAIKAPEPKSKQLASLKPKLKSFDDLPDNQLRSTAPQAASSKMFAVKGGSEIGATNSPLGSRFAAYSEMIQDITHRNWHPDRSIPNPSPVTIHFDLQRDGSVRNVQLVRKSGNESLDQSVLSAVQDSRYPPLPGEYESSSAPVEFTFRLNR